MLVGPGRDLASPRRPHETAHAGVLESADPRVRKALELMHWTEGAHSRLIERGVTGAALAPIWDPMAVRICFMAGVGGKLQLRFGGKTAKRLPAI